VAPRGGGALVRVVFFAPVFLMLPVVLALFVAFPVGQDWYSVGLAFAGMYALVWVFFLVEKANVVRDLHEMLSSNDAIV
jgi:phosphotransferase system  glucose/maltose/N-acetylglucosamine-specific IIC component